MLYHTEYSTYKVEAIRLKYRDGNLAIQLRGLDGAPVSVLTVNLPESKDFDEDLAYVDTNNNPTAEEFIEEYELGTPTGEVGYSGFCTYPLYKFNLNKLVED